MSALFRLRPPSEHRDAHDAVSRFRRLMWGLAAGIVWGAGVAALAVRENWEHPLLAGVAAFLFGVLFIHWGSGALLEGSAALMSQIHLPSGSTARPGYSKAEAMAARGRHDDAVELYREAAEARPEDPEPCLRIARLQRDETGELEEAARWFRRARGREGTTPELERLITEELVELYRKRMEEPRRAIPELARYVDRHGEEARGDWAREELERLKRELVDEEA